MPLTAGTRLGPYEIVAPLGAGGMGEVYRARDPRLGRDVAIKLIPDAFAQDSERLARFEREARLLASLQHANIAVLHGLEEAGGRRFLVMECVEGESLAHRLDRGALPLGEALEVARAVAAALEAAHEGGIVHRDLKPGNVMVTPAGDVKVLDFGLAKGGASGGSDPNMSASPTMTYAGTQAGVILGTAAYMSPEQARGKTVDRRTDIWSFGCVLFECLTGRKAFAGETISDIVACILQVEPAWTALPADTPERVRALLRRCLEKDAKRRLRDIGEARIEIEDLLAAGRSGAAPAAAAAEAPARGAAKPPWAAIAITAVLAAAATWFAPKLLAPKTAPVATRFEVAAPKGRVIPAEAAIANLSPDGRTLAVFARDSSDKGCIWVRRMDALEARELPGTSRATGSFWSPDSRTLAFFSGDRQLMRIAIDGGDPEVICETKAARGGAWGRDGTILFAPYSNGGIFRVSANGGAPVQVTRPDSARGVTGHRFPVWLPDGKHFLFVTVPAGADGKGGLCVGSVEGGPPKEIGRLESGVAWAEPHWLLTERKGSLVAWRFDTRALRIVGEPVTIGDPLVGSTYSGGPLMSVARDGTVAFLTRQDLPKRFEWFDLQGRSQGAPPVPPGPYGAPRVSPDGRHVLAGSLAEPTRSDLVLADLERGVSTTVTQPEENVTLGIWSRDGNQVAYVEEYSQTVRIRAPADGSMRTFLADDRAYKRVYDFSPDGKHLVYGRLDAGTRWDVWALPLDGGAPVPCVRGNADDEYASFSPDGRWLSYSTNESGVAELCVVPFLTPGLKYQVTVGGGGGGWSRLGQRVLFMLGRTPNVLYAADARTSPSFSVGPPSTIGRAPDQSDTWGWDLGPDERRVLATVPAEKAAPQAVTILQNWQAAIRKR